MKQLLVFLAVMQLALLAALRAAEPAGPSVLASGAGADETAANRYLAWKRSGSLYVLTTPDGANLPATASEDNFPVLVRLNKDWFKFSEAKPNGDDIRIASGAGAPLAYQIDEWDAEAGTAAIWVRIPVVKGNDRQEIKLYWGNPDAASESNGRAVFNETNGYLSVLHMNDPVKDSVATLDVKDVGTTAAAGIVGAARHFSDKHGIFGGDKISDFPIGASPHTTEAWFRAEQANGSVVAWGNEHAQGKVVMRHRSPAHVKVDCFFSGANVEGASAIPMRQWVHVAHTYRQGESLLYVNGVVDGSSTSPGSPLDIKNPARMWIGGWYHKYNFVGDIDEARISRIARSSDWIKLQYENQKPNQSAVGLLVQSGGEFSVTPQQVTIDEGGSLTFHAAAGGAQKVYWIEKRDGRERVVAADRLSYRFNAGRTVGDTSLSLQFKAIYAGGEKTKDVSIAIKEAMPEPVFTLQHPVEWDGRQTIEVVPHVTNAKEMQAQGAGKLNYRWTVSDIAVTKEVTPEKLILSRAQNSGQMTVTAMIDNEGVATVRSTTIMVKEPTKDVWVQRTPEKDERPVDNQFYARDDKNEGTLFYNGTLAEPADSVFLKLYADEKLIEAESRKPSAGGSYAFSVKLKPGLTKYKVEFGSKSGNIETLRHTASNLVCGDAYLINGQSNAVATDFGKEDPTFRSEWIRTFGAASRNAQDAALWGNAVHRGHGAEKFGIGYWGMELARRLVEDQKIPICIINGAVGGTRIDQHQRNPDDPTDFETIYGRLLLRVQKARLTHGIRGVLWHQGENDQGADGPTGGFGWETYRQYFIDLAAAWKQDFPNIRHYYVFQIWPKSCAMGIHGSDNRLREVQRNLPTAFSKLSVMSTLGIKPPGGCHFPADGYAEFARLICPLVERDHYGKVAATSITPPNLKRTYFTGDARDEITLEFDQPVVWTDALLSQFSLDGDARQIASGSASGNLVRLKLKSASQAAKVTYLDSASWNPDNLLYGSNGIAALTFCEVPIQSRPTAP